MEKDQSNIITSGMPVKYTRLTASEAKAQTKEFTIDEMINLIDDRSKESVIDVIRSEYIKDQFFGFNGDTILI